MYTAADANQAPMAPPSALLLPALLAAALAGAAASGAALPRQARPENQVKAVFLLNFAKFVEWPAAAFASADAPLLVGVLGEDPFGAFLDEAARGETILGRAVRVRRFAEPAALEPVHVLFVSPSEDERLPEVFAAIQGAPVLTVGETGRFARRGGVIRLTREGERLRFVINAPAAERSGLRLGSQLLKVAKEVRSGEAP